ncbi:cobalamin-binding protein [Alteromonas pelagimontana]|uniref:Cobalamin-binding protein n=1 Tax=Alteromonas pelagimontana TaxID=1858656 RepID=A0A6M4MD95_9ALTE|nr:cobalamin-binding protein [Alteromonas pelagimontana]QJR80106.1 cobalamin-binding protein [Alteromonas pelagimontana]
MHKRLFFLTLTVFCASIISINVVSAKEMRIVSLSPHLTEWVYSLGRGDFLVGASQASDYPAAAKALPRIADFNGADIAAIVALEPNLVLAWGGGNKPQDIARLKGLGIPVFISTPLQPEDISRELRKLGPLLERQSLADKLADEFDAELAAITRTYDLQPGVSVFYYMWTQPLMTVGPNAWASALLSHCGARTLFADSPVDYPQVSIQEVIRRQPDFLVAATSQSIASQKAYWQPHRKVLSAPLLMVNPDISSRFTLRLLSELETLCQQLHP